MIAADVTALRLALQTGGYAPIPVRGKKPRIDEWQTKLNVSHDEITSWKQHPGTGILAGPTPGLDLDIRDSGAAAAAEELVREWFDGRGEILVRFGEAPKRLFPFRTESPFRKIRVEFKAPNGTDHAIELLGNGQQFVVAGIHPDTKQPYSWQASRTPWTVPRSNLPEINEAEARELIDLITEMLRERFGFERAQINGQDADNPTAGTADADEKPPVDVAARLANIHFGNIHDTWKSCMGSMLRGGMPADDVFHCLLQAAEQSPACQPDPKHKLWRKSLADIMTWYMRTDPEFVLQLSPEMQINWHRVASQGTKPKLAWRPDLSQLHVRRTEELNDPAPEEKSGQPAGEPPKNSAPRRKYRFKLIPFADLKPGPEQPYLVDELIPVAGLVVVWGNAKSFKSFWTLDVMFHVAMGWEYRDRAVRQGPVVYCAFEGAHGYKKRGEALRRHYNVDDAASSTPLWVISTPVNLIADHAALIGEIAEQMAHLCSGKSPAAVVLDTLNKSLHGSEGKDADMSAYIRAAEAIRDAFSCVVIIVHHCGYDLTHPRGHTSLPGAVDTQLAITREGDTFTVKVELMRDGPEGLEFVNMVKSVEVGQDLNGKMLTSLVVAPSDAPACGAVQNWPPSLSAFYPAVKHELAAHGEFIQLEIGILPVRAVGQENVRQRFYKTYAVTESDEAKRQDTRKKAFQRAIKDALRRGMIRTMRDDADKAWIWIPDKGDPL